jgi:WD40 repeat protein
LEFHAQSPHATELLGWEYHYLKGLLGSQSRVLPHDAGIDSIALSPDESTIAVGAGDDVYLWGIGAEPRLLQRIPAPESEDQGSLVLGVAFSAKGDQLAVMRYVRMGVSTATVYPRWKRNLESKTTRVQSYWLHRGSLLAFAGKTLVIAGGFLDHEAKSTSAFPVQLWDYESDANVRPLEGTAGRIAVSPDGSRLAAVMADESIGLWDTKKWQQLHTMGEPVGCNGLAFATSGQRLAVLRGDGVDVWALDDQPRLASRIRMDQSGNHSLSDVAFLGEDRLVIAHGYSVDVWDLNDDAGDVIREPSARASGHASDAVAVAAMMDGNRFFSGSSDQTLRIWSLDDLLSQPHTLTPFRSFPFAPVFSDDERLLSAMSSRHGQVTVYDAKNLQPIQVLGQEPYQLDWNADRDMEEIPTQGRRATVISLVNGRLHLRVFDGEGERVIDRYLDEIGDWNRQVPMVATLTRTLTDHTIELVREKRLQSADELPAEGRNEVYDCSVKNRPSLRVFDAKGDRIIDGYLESFGEFAIEVKEIIRQLHRMERRGDADSADNVVHLVSMITGHGVQPWMASWFANDGHTLVTPIFHRAAQFAGPPPIGPELMLGLRFWELGEDVSQPSRTVRFPHPSSEILGMKLSPDGQFFVSVHIDGEVIYRQVSDGAIVDRIPPSKEITFIQFSPDGKLLVLIANSEIRFFDAATRAFLYRRKTSSGKGFSDRQLRFSPDGRHFAGNSGNKLYLFETESREAEIGILRGGLRSFLRSIAWSPDGRTLATATNNDTSVVLWNVATRRQIATVAVPTRCAWVHFSADGRRLYLGDREWSVTVLEVDRE